MVVPTSTTTIKFLCSYGGKILPRYPDGKLRYHGGETRVLAVHRSISFSELLIKLGELCGTSVTLRCQLPTEDLDALVSITSDEDLINVIEEYDRVASPATSPSPPRSLKIRAFLSLPKKISPTPSSSSASSSSSTTTFEATSPKSPSSSTYSAAVSGSGSYTSRFAVSSTNSYVYSMSKPPANPNCYQKSAGKLPYYAHRYSSRSHLIHNGNHWQ